MPMRTDYLLDLDVVRKGMRPQRARLVVLVAAVATLAVVAAVEVAGHLRILQDLEAHHPIHPPLAVEARHRPAKRQVAAVKIVQCQRHDCTSPHRMIVLVMLVL